MNGEPKVTAYSLDYNEVARRANSQSSFHGMPRERKITWLETEICLRVDRGLEVKDLLKALELLQNNRIEDEQVILRYGKSTAATLLDQFLAGVMILCVIFLLSLTGSMICGGKQTRFCRDTRAIPLALYNYLFRETTPTPQHRPSILPLNPQN